MSFIKTIFSFFLMALIVFAGPGITWVESYCSTCKGNVSANKKESHCCGLIARQQEKAACSCCQGEQSADHSSPTQGLCSGSECQGSGKGCCLVENLRFDWDSVQSFVNVSAASVALLRWFSVVSVPEVASCRIAFFAGGKSPPVQTPQEYLSFIRVLLI